MKKLTRVISTIFVPHKNNVKFLLLITFVSLFSFLSLINSVNVQNSVISDASGLKPVPHINRNIEESERTEKYIVENVPKYVDKTHNKQKDNSMEKSLDQYKGTIYFYIITIQGFIVIIQGKWPIY